MHTVCSLPWSCKLITQIHVTIRVYTSIVVFHFRSVSSVESPNSFKVVTFHVANVFITRYSLSSFQRLFVMSSTSTKTQELHLPQLATSQPNQPEWVAACYKTFAISRSRAVLKPLMLLIKSYRSYTCFFGVHCAAWCKNTSVIRWFTTAWVHIFQTDT